MHSPIDLTAGIPYPLNPFFAQFLMEKVALLATLRTSAESVKDLRKQGKIPGIVYGNEQHAMLHFDEVALKKAYVKAGESTLVELDMGDKKLPVLFHSIDQDPVSDRMIHVDFYAVNMKKEVEADVHIRFDGESQAIKDGAIMVTALDTVTVRALPANLPHDLPVDLSKLAAFEDTITVADIVVPEGVTILNEPEEVIAIAQEPRAIEVEEAPVVAEGAVAEGAEGAAAAEGAEGGAAAEGDKKEEKK